VKSISY